MSLSAPKRIISTVVAAIVVLAFSVFSISNALALRNSMAKEARGSASLTAVIQCKEAKARYENDVANAKAKGLSLQLSPEDVQSMVNQVKEYRKQICYEAKYGTPMPLTSARQLCKEARKNFKMQIENAKANALSLQIPADQLKLQIQAIKDFRKEICAEAAGK